MLKILLICVTLSFLLVSSAMRNRVSVPARRKSKKSAPTSNLETSVLPLALRNMSQTFPTCAGQGWPRSRRLEKHAVRT